MLMKSSGNISDKVHGETKKRADSMSARFVLLIYAMCGLQLDFAAAAAFGRFRAVFEKTHEEVAAHSECGAAEDA